MDESAAFFAGDQKVRDFAFSAMKHAKNWLKKHITIRGDGSHGYLATGKVIAGDSGK